MRVFQIEGEWGIDNLRLSNRPEPEAGPGQVVVQMSIAALNARDLIVPERGYGRATGELPLIPISDGVGEVVATGPGVTRFNVGDRVCPTYFQNWTGGEPTPERFASALGGPLDGVMAERMCLSQEGVVRVPDYLTDAEAATLPCAALTAWSAVATHGRTQPGDRLLIQGTGGVALFALAFAKLHGAHVTVISSSDDKLARVREMGAEAQPVRIVASHGLDLPFPSRLSASAGDGPVWLIHGEGQATPASLSAWTGAGVRCLGVPASGDRLDLPAVMQRLASEGLTRIFCEGGGSLAASLLAAGLVDRLVLMTAGKMIGSEGRPSVGPLDLTSLTDAPTFQLRDVRALGGDVMQTWARA